MNKYWEHFKTICKHKFIVGRLCIKCGFIKRGLLHDMSKFSFVEFFGTGKYYQGNKSPISAEKAEKGYSMGWLHHKGHNPHHWEFWIDDNKPIKIPYEYVVEMICDWVGAGIVYNKTKVDEDMPYPAPLQYFNKYLPERHFHPETQRLCEYFLKLIAEEGINAFIKSARSHKDYFL